MGVILVQKKCSGVRFDEELNTFRGCLTDGALSALSFGGSEGWQLLLFVFHLMLWCKMRLA